jgi:hypothetical protein
MLHFLIELHQMVGRRIIGVIMLGFALIIGVFMYGVGKIAKAHGTDYDERL